MTHRTELGPTTGHVGAFFALTFLLSLPFWLWGSSGVFLIPGLPVSGLMAFMPALAALVVARFCGRGAAHDLVRETFDLQRLQGKLPWIALTLALFPFLLALHYVSMALISVELPEFRASAAALVPMAIAFFVAGLAEEIGWFGYAFPRLEQRRDALRAALIIGVVWAVWHTIPYIQTGRGLAFVAWHSVVTVATRVIAAWLFVNTGRSVLAAALFHATCNVAYFSFPNGGSHYDAGLFMPIALGAAILIATFGGASLQGVKQKPA